jgi:putative ABC transport system permease protein
VVSDSTARTLAGTDSRTDVGVVVQAGGTDAALTRADRAAALAATEPDAALMPADRDRLAAIPGARATTGVVVGHAALVQRDGKLGAGRPERAGTSWDATERFTLTTGRGPAQPGEVALGEGVASAAKLSVGDRTRVILADGSSDSAIVVGLFTYRTLGAETAPSVAYDESTALKLLGDRFDRVELATASGTDSGALAGTVRQILGAGDQRHVYTGSALVAEGRSISADSAQSTRASLLAFAAVALLAGMFVIANTFSMLVTQRTRQFALLRAVGASRRQVRLAVVTEAAVLGLIGSTIGVVLGVGLGLLALRAARPAGETLVYAVSPIGIAAGYAVGVLVTVVSAYGSARRGASVAPVAALRTDAALPRRSLLVRTVSGLAVFALGALAVASTATTELTDSKRLIGMGGAIVAWLGLLMLAPLLASAVLRPLTRLLGRRSGPVTRLALRNAIRDPRRTAATASALTVGLALVCAFATVGESFIAMAGSSIRGMVPATTTVLQPATTGSLLGTDVVDKVKSTPGIGAVLAAPRGNVQWRHTATDLGTTSVSAVDPGALAATLRPKITSGSGDLGKGVLLLKNDADEHHLRPGDALNLSFGAGTARAVTVAGVYDAIEGSVAIYIDQAAVPANLRGGIETVYATGTDPAAVRSSLDGAFRDRPDVRVTDRDGLVNQRVSTFQLALSVIYALFGAALIIAIFGVVNTLALSVMERTREIGVFRALGASRGLVRRSVRLESVIIASYGGVLGVLVGLALGGVMQHIMLSRELWRIQVPYVIIATTLVGMVVVGVLAAVWPARRAARTDILNAVVA